MTDLTKHWDKVYTTKQLNEVSWYQPEPKTSLQLIDELSLDKKANIIDIGGGDSFLADNLLARGFENINVLDISQAALERGKKRLGKKADKIHWICSDINDYTPERPYDLWHDRAAFHFLTEKRQIERYVEIVRKGVKKDGFLILATFSEDGPKKCSGLTISQYSEIDMSKLFEDSFEKVKTFKTDHNTPFDTVQNFTFGVFKRK